MTALAILVALVVAHPLAAQLISPGKLSRAHANLEGLRNCTLCHELRRSGISPALCLDCHKPLARRIGAGEGFHGSLAEKDCAVCHREHFGVDFALVRMDTASFDHVRTGWPLQGEHAQTSCRDCHKADLVAATDVRSMAADHGTLNRTFLGLSTQCRTCHEPDSPHEDQFRGRSCEECHSASGWKDTSAFDHATTAFKLTGAHVTVACARCHAATPRPGKTPWVRYADTSSECASCHAGSSPHGSQFTGRSCAACHDAADWKGASRFDHDRARFPLTGMHRTVRCAQCHTSSRGSGSKVEVRYRGVAYSSCKSCHDDPHRGAMAQACGTCHTTAGWTALNRSGIEASFDHATTGFTLNGKHGDVPCAACHDPRMVRSSKTVHIAFDPGTASHTFPRPRSTACRGCHVDAHDGVFADRSDGGACRACHGEAGWTPATFDLARHNRETPFLLEGAHMAVPCGSCHRKDGSKPPQFRLGEVRCRSCHEPSDPHGDQFGSRACSECHTVTSFHITAFDHSRTRFPLTGAHRDAPCASCHHTERDGGGEPTVRYTPLGRECSDCHGGSP
jgi:hypothetical protein